MNEKRKTSSARDVERSVPENSTESAEAVAIGSAVEKLRGKNAGMDPYATI
jgi:hypothetical protein